MAFNLSGLTLFRNSSGHYTDVSASAWLFVDPINAGESFNYTYLDAGGTDILTESFASASISDSMLGLSTGSLVGKLGISIERWSWLNQPAYGFLDVIIVRPAEELNAEIAVDYLFFLSSASEALNSAMSSDDGLKTVLNSAAVSKIPDGTFAPGQPIAINEIQGVNTQLVGTNSDDVLIGGPGDDWVRPGLGNDTIDGGFGDDVVVYENVQYGVTANISDNAQSEMPANAISGGGQFVDIVSGIESFHLTYLDDRFFSDKLGDYVFLRSGNDLIQLEGVSRNIIPGSGNDTIEADAAIRSSLSYEADLYDGAGAQTSGISVVFSAEASGTVQNDGWGGVDTFEGVDRIKGSQFDDVMTGAAGAQQLSGNSGDDSINGGSGDDWIHGGEGADVLSGGEGNDRLIGDSGNDTLDGGLGVDRADYRSSPNGIYANVSSKIVFDGYGSQDVLKDIENITGTSFDDVIVGDEKNNAFAGKGGNDEIHAGDGNDYVEGGAGNDTLDGGKGSFDVLAYSGEDGNRGVLVDLESGLATDSFGGNDLVGAFEIVRGTTYSDQIRGDNHDNSLYGFDGDDVIDGRGGEDGFWGGSGDDSITFGLDSLSGAATRGWYYSEAGNDQIDMGNAWGWLRYDVFSGDQRALINFTDESLFFVEESMASGSDYIDFYRTIPEGYNDVVITELEPFSVRDQFGDVDTYLNTNDGAHFWGTALNDVFVTSKHFWWSATAGNDQIIVIGDEGGTLAAPWESGVNWSLANSSFAYIGEDGNNYTISLVQGALSGLAGGEGDDTLTGTAADERFKPNGGDNVVTGGGGRDSFRFSDAEGHTLITDYVTGERIQFDADRIGFDVDNLSSEITTEYDDATDQTKLYVQSATVARHHIASVNGEFVIASREYDARWDDVNVELVAAELQGDNTIIGTDEDDLLYGFDGNDVIDGRGGEDRFWGGTGDDSITFGVDTVTGEATRGRYYSEAGNDQIDLGNEWGWLYYDEFAGALRALINFTDEAVFFVEESVDAGSDFITTSLSAPQGYSNVVITELDSFSVRDQFGDVDTYLNTDEGAHFWGTALDDVFVTSKHFWWSATAGNDQIIVIGDEGGTLEAPWENGVNWSLANSSFAYTGEDGNNYTISLVEGSLSGLAGGEGDDTFIGTAADERFSPGTGDNVVTGGGGWDTYRLNDADGHTLITDYATGERIQFDAERIGFDVSNLSSEITTEYSDATDQTKLYVESAKVARHHIATVNGEFVIASREYDARWDDVNIRLVERVDGAIMGTFYDDEIFGSDASDTIYGLEGDDAIHGGGGDDTIYGGLGADWIYGGPGNDTLDAGLDDDNDRLDFRNENKPVVVDLEAQTAAGETIGNDIVINFDRVIGSHFADTLFGSQQGDSFTGEGGNDIIDGRGGFDFVWFGRSPAAVSVNLMAQTASGGEDNDTLISIEGVGGSNFDDTIVGSDVDEYFELDNWGDVFTPGNNQGGVDYLDGGDGVDTIALGDWDIEDPYNADLTGAKINLLTGEFTDPGGNGDTVLNIEKVVGTPLDDYIVGDDLDNHLWGGLGNDQLFGGDGADVLDGGVGDDELYGGLGNDILVQSGSGSQLYDGGEGIDTFVTDTDDFNGGFVPKPDFTGLIDLASGFSGVKENPENPLNDEVRNIENVTTRGEWNWEVIGDHQSNVLLTGRGQDTLDGGSGNDTLDGGASSDLLTGGEGSDAFVFRGGFGHDTVTDFDASDDELQFFSDDASPVSISELIETLDQNGNRVLSTADGLSSVTLEAVRPPSEPAFDIVLTSTAGDVARFEIYATEAANSGDPGLEDIQFVLSHGVNDMVIDETSIETTFALGVPVYDALTGELELAAIAFPAFSDFATPVLTFDATILNEESPFSITINEILVDDTSQAAVQEQVDFTSVDITTTLLDRFGNSLTDTDVSAFVATPGDDVFLRLVSTSSDGSVFEIVASPSEAVSSVDFELVDPAGVRDFEIGEALSEWVVEANTTAADIVRFAGFGSVDGSQDLAAGQETVLATFTTTSDPNIAVEGIVLNQTAQRDIVFGEVAPLSQAGGVSVHEVMRGADVYLFADKQVDEASSDAITANDALQALRLAVGLTKQDGTAEWHDYLAADINRDGQVSANDALNILKSAVGLDDGVSAHWVFVDGSGDWTDIGRKNTVYEEGVRLDNVTADGPVDMTGILVGDVNGSYVV